MNETKTTPRDPLQGTQVMSTVATGGAGGIFQARVGALYLANMLTGLPTAFCLHGARVEELRFEARYQSVHTDDVYCRLTDAKGTWLQLIQCKRGLNATAGNTDFIDGLQGAWRDFLGIGGSPFDRACDLLVLATITSASAANQAAKRLCELARASLGLADFLQKVDSKLFNKKHKDTWEAFKTVSQDTLADKYTEELVYQLLRRLRVDIHDLGTDSSQELSLVQALLYSGQPGDSGQLVWDGLFSYVQEQGITVGTVTPSTWAQTAKEGLQAAVSRLSSSRGLGNVAERFTQRALLQLSLIANALPNGTHIPRGECAGRMLATLDERQLVIVTGGPGAGKSAVVSELAPLLHESGPLFFFRGDELDVPTLAAVQSLNGLQDPVLGIDTLLRIGAPTVIIDSLEKALEAQNPGALEELLALVRKNKSSRLCITTRSYALNGLYTNFLYSFSSQVVDVPALTDVEIATAVAGSALEGVVAKDAGVKEVLRTPYYLQLAFKYASAGTALPSASGNDLRQILWTERVAPSKGVSAAMRTRRKAAFDEVCYLRTERFAQFVETPEDAEAVESLLKDGVLAQDDAARVSPAHDVLEDWSLFFRVEREVRSAERGWSALFAKLGSHAGMRRALRSWTAQRSAEGDDDAYALLEAALRHDSTIAQLWRDEIAIGLLRSERVEDLVARLWSNDDFSSVALLQRLSHLLRVACKGPTSLDYSHLASDPAKKELVARVGMAAPVGKAWDVMIRLVARAFPSLPPQAHSWVIQLAEDAIAHDDAWYKPSPRVADVFSMAEHYCWRDNDTWYREKSVGKRFYELLCRCSGADRTKFKVFIDTLVKRVSEDREDRDVYAEERLEFLTNVKHCREPVYFNADLVRTTFWALYTEPGPLKERHFGIDGWEAAMGLSQRVTHAFFPPSVLQGPFRGLLLYSFAESVRFVVDLCNHAAACFAASHPEEVTSLPPEQSPNGRAHIHDWRLWAAYRGHSVTSYLLNCALMSLEERLLIEAKLQPEIISDVLEFIFESGESSFTTGLVASVLTAHPNLVTEKMLSLFKCPQFFADDIARYVGEASALAIHGGHDGLDDARQNERIASNKLPHRKQHLEMLVLQLQIIRPDLREGIFAILDKHIEDIKTAQDVPDGWRMALKRMDARGMKLGEPVDNGKYVPLEIANLEPELKQVSDEAQSRSQLMNRLAAVRLWAGAVTQPTLSSASGAADRFSSSSEVYQEFQYLLGEVTGEDEAMLLGLDDELPCALIQRWPSDTSEALKWAKDYLLDVTSMRLDNDAWVRRSPMTGELRAKTLILLASVDPNNPKLPASLANIITEPVWKVRRAGALAISEFLRLRQPQLAEKLTTALALYAEALDTTIVAAQRRKRDFVEEARDATSKALVAALTGGNLPPRPSPKSLVAVKEWTIALDAARSETPETWRVQALMTQVRLLADQEGKPRVDRYDPDYVDFEARWEVGDLLASELLAQETDKTIIFEALDYCIEHGPELSERVLESTLRGSMKQEYTNAAAFWRVWDRVAAKLLTDESLRTRSRRLYSKNEKPLAVLLFQSIPWAKAFHDLPLLTSRPRFVADCLSTAGDNWQVLEHLLALMAGVGRASAVPSALIPLRDAIAKAPTDLFNDGSSLWDAETVCQAAVHEHRQALIRDVTLRQATLDVLDRLVDAGSSLAFQLRDYLATSSPGIPSKLLVSSSAAQPIK
ncbi:hypothetical protein DF142_30555 [Burkholderia cenocepacia]|uniref:hypothetical protein n=1 Tax=Burkholderia cenocepacia TaxID=95486 RepID=UPI000F57C089|nr:hypothetical protein [Burkholderia cenocepacia]RQU33437.1 hypothetical protein DF142_30555 [Burkholderia cenocepacia]RQU58588.1 hypothetical protein DF140_30710 [Burkholderia cenocepacia]